MGRRYIVSFVIAVGLLALTVWLTWQPKSKCGHTAGRLGIEHIHQVNSSWCWVATVSEVLKWFELQNSEQCHLYDLWYGKRTCLDMVTNPSWTAVAGNNEFGAPEDAANRYRQTYGGIIVTTRESPGYGGDARPLDFGEIRDRICPRNGNLGEPFIWAYVEETLPDGTPLYHDAVVFGYAFIPYETPQLLFVYDPEDPPDAPTLEPYTYEYDWYADPEIWAEDVMISQLFWPKSPQFFGPRFPSL